MPFPYTGGSPAGLYGQFRLGQDLFGGGGSEGPYGGLARYLQSLGLNIPPYTSGRKFAKGSLLGELLLNLQRPTGLEGFFGPEFQQRATQATLAQTSAPFEEAGRQLTSRYLGGGGGFAGGLTAARGQFARLQGQTQAGAIGNMLMELESQRAGLAQGIEGIKQNRLALLANYLSGLQSQHAQGRMFGAQQDAMIGQGVGQGISGIISLLSMLGVGCWVAGASLGVDDPDFQWARIYLNVLAPEGLRTLYYAQGRALASVVARERALALRLAPVFRNWAATAREVFGG